MDTQQTSNLLIRPSEAFEQSAADRVAIGQRLAAMLETEAWADLRRGVQAKQARIADQLMMQPGDRDHGFFAKLTGEMTGVAALELIATQLIEDGEAADQEIRAREEGF